MRLIDADELMESLKRKKCETAKVRYTEGYNDALMRFRSMVHSAPTVEECKHGHWIVRTDFGNGCREIRCSECGKTGFWRTQPFYCPYCGAIMDEKCEE